MRVRNRLLTVLAATSMLVATLAVPALAGPEGTFLSRINSSRAAAGLPPVERYWDLTDDARAHTNRMIDAGHIYHNSNLGGVTGVWQALGENVGVGIDANSLHDAFMGSSGHRANILGNYNYVGIGAKTDADGLLWVTVIFMRAEPGLNGGGDATTTTTAPPTTTTTQPNAHLPESTTTTTAPPTTTTTTSAPSTTTTAPPKATTTKASPPTSGSAQPVAVSDAFDAERGMVERFSRPGGLPAYAI
jgi:hypothetical protein